MDASTPGSQSIRETAGAQWVERYLHPLLGRLRTSPATARLNLLQLDPDDESEAVRLRKDGYLCDSMVFDAARLRERPWEQAPVLAQGLTLPAESGRYDLVMTGRFGRLAANEADRRTLAGELARVCRPGGAVLLSIGNRRCPLDLSGNAPSRLHGWKCRRLVTLRELERLFVEQCGFASLECLSVAGMFGGNRLRRLPRWVGTTIEGYLRQVSAPRRRWLYGSFLSPMLCVWIRR